MNSRTCACLLLICVSLSAQWSGAQENQRLPLVEEIAPPRPNTELLDLQPRRILPRRTQAARNEDARLKRINDMLLELKRRAKEREVISDSPPPSPTADRLKVEQPMIANPSPNVPPPTTVTLPVAAPTIEVQPAVAAPDETPISLTTTVDSLALANNLFAQGKVEMARPIYEKLMRQPQLPKDSVWIQYQLACCYRIEGRIKDATKMYRMAGSSKEEPYWANRAQWWLDFLGRAQQLEEQRAQLEKQLEMLKKVVDGSADK